MLKRIVPTMIFAMLLLDMFVLAFDIQQIGATGTICIRADGSVDPSDAPILSVDNVIYTFTDNIHDEIVVERNNTIIHGNGYTLQGLGNGYGFYLSGISNVTIKKASIKDFSQGNNSSRVSFLSHSTTIHDNNTISNHSLQKKTYYLTISSFNWQSKWLH